MDWSPKLIPSQTGKIAIVTGATGGIGLETARELARAGATVILAGRNAGKGQAALSEISHSVRTADIRFELVDLGDLASIAAFADRMQSLPRLDLLVNNAGVMAPPKKLTTSDGFELQFGTNHLGHFALTSQLLPGLARTPGARVVSVSSTAAYFGRMDFDNLNAERRYSPMGAYFQSKLANALFVRELNTRSQRHGWGILALCAQPGLATTDLVANGPGAGSLLVRMTGVMNAFFTQSAAAGAEPSLRAATMPDVAPNEFYGPTQRLNMRGPADRTRIPRRSMNDADARHLWDASETLTGVHFNLPEAAVA